MHLLKSIIHKFFSQQKITANIGWLLLDKLFRLGLNFILTAWIARYLGKELFGLWSYSMAFVALFGVASTLGLYNILLRDYVRKDYPLNHLLGSAFFLKFLGGIVTVALAFGSISLIQDNPRIHQLVFIIGLGYIAQAVDVIDYYFQSQLKARYTIFARVLAFACISAAKVYAIFQEYPLEAFVWLSSLELGIAALFLILIFQHRINSIRRWKIRWDIMSYLIRICLPVMLAELAIIIYMKIDQFMLGELISLEEVGKYAAAAKLSEIWYLFPSIICSSFFPSITNVFPRDKAAYFQKLQTVYDLMATLSIGIAVVVVLGSEFLIHLFYGEDYTGAALILRIHIWAGIFVFLGTAGTQQLVIENLMHITLYKTIMGMFANIGLNLLLIPGLHSEGAAVATLVSYAISAFFADAFFPQTRKVFFFKLKSLNIFRLFYR